MGENASALQWIPWALIVLGWIVVNRQNNERERRKEIRAKIDFLKEAMDDLEDMSILHHTKEQAPAECMKIKRALTRLGKEMKVLDSAGLKIERADRAVMRLRQAITLRNFESKRYSPLPSDDPLIAEIGAASDDLRYLFESAYSKKFHDVYGWFYRDI